MTQSNNKRFFIAGTDTDAGKTLVTCALIQNFQALDLSVAAIKPVAAGCQWLDEQWKNDDALQMQRYLKPSREYSQINPIGLKSAIAPHIAAEEENYELSVGQLSKVCQIAQQPYDVVLVEGAGGWLVPLNQTQTLADFVEAEALDVILVVGMKLGCINHALLTVQGIKAKHLNLVGWIANSVNPEMQRFDENIESLATRIDAPLLGIIPFIESVEMVQTASSYVNIQPLL